VASAVVAGSLGKGNLGDEALLRAFLRRHRPHYRSVIVLTDGEVPAHEDVTRLPPPALALGRRFWFGATDRRRKRIAIHHASGGGPLEYVWLGGLLGHIAPHLQARWKELEWAASLNPRLIYYFGDADDRLNDTRYTRPLIDRMNSLESWIAVRSAEAAAALRDAGLGGEIHVGVDPVLYDRAVRWGTPFERRAPDAHAVAINPCGHPAAGGKPIWLDAARAAVAHSLPVRWISLCDPDDLDSCRALMEATAAGAPQHPQTLHSGSNAEEGLLDAAVCVAGRYHGMIFALTRGVPTIPVSYGPKMTRLARLLGLEHWVTGEEPDAHEGRTVPIGTLVNEALDGRWAMDEKALAAALAAHTRALETLTVPAP
jgi:hypothetical protein